MDLQRLLRSKPALAGLGLVGLLAVVAVARRKSSGSAASTAGAPVAAGAPVGAYDSTGSDISSTLGQFAQEQQQQLAQFAQQLSSSLDGMRNAGQNTPTSPTTSVPTTSSPTTPTPAAAPAPAPAAAGVGTTAGVPTGSINRGTVGGVAKYLTIRPGQSWATVEKTAHESDAQLRGLNGGSLTRLKAGDRVRIG